MTARRPVSPAPPDSYAGDRRRHRRRLWLGVVLVMASAAGLAAWRQANTSSPGRKPPRSVAQPQPGPAPSTASPPGARPAEPRLPEPEPRLEEPTVTAEDLPGTALDFTHAVAELTAGRTYWDLSDDERAELARLTERELQELGWPLPEAAPAPGAGP
jgi:hypothetical protein